MLREDETVRQLGMPSAQGLGLGDARLKLPRQICGIFELFSTPEQIPAL